MLQNNDELRFYFRMIRATVALGRIVPKSPKITVLKDTKQMADIKSS